MTDDCYESVSVVLTDAEQAYLDHICEMYEFDVEMGSTGRSGDGWAWFLSDEDATGFDLTNEQPRDLGDG